MNMGKNAFFKRIDQLENICLVAMFAIMVAAIFLQIIMRFVFNNSLVWSEELGKFIFVWISWLGISIGERKNEHIKITLITDKLPPLGKKISEIAAYTVLVPAAALAAACPRKAERSRGKRSPPPPAVDRKSVV